MGLFDFFKQKSQDNKEVIQDYNNTYSNDNLTSNQENNSTYDVDFSTSDSEFFMEVDDVFTIMGRGTVVTGTIKTGKISLGDKVKINRKDGTTITSVISGIEMFRKLLDVAEAGDNVGLLIKGTKREDVSRGDTITI